MNFVLTFGPSAVSKMTLGKALAARTGYKLMHNHVSLELANRFFDFGTEPFRKLGSLVRFGVFDVEAGRSSRTHHHALQRVKLTLITQ